MATNEEYLQSILTAISCIQNSNFLDKIESPDLKDRFQKIDTEVWEIVDHITDMKEDI